MRLKVVLFHHHNHNIFQTNNIDGQSNEQESRTYPQIDSHQFDFWDNSGYVSKNIYRNSHHNIFSDNPNT